MANIGVLRSVLIRTTQPDGRLFRVQENKIICGDNMEEKCSDSVTAARLSNQTKGGGSIPASELYFRCGEIGEAKELVMRYHYSHRFPPSTIYCGTFHLKGGLFGVAGKAIAACCFGNPPTRWSEKVLELQRLVRHPEYKTELSKLISLTVRMIQKEGIYDLLVSFADETQGHKGYVYRACCWNYHSKRKRQIDGLIIDGEFIVGRTCNALYGTRSPKKLKTLHPKKDIKPHYDNGKHLYWKSLSKSGIAKAEQLGLKKNSWKEARAGQGALFE